jgi:GNAT superfamily N-acetyltransferase
MHIRNAVPADAVAACTVLRRSIAELCIADHHNDPGILRQWLGNKTPAIFMSWLAEAGNSVLVAVDGESTGEIILAVGAVKDTGEITLNYVSPDARFRGVSRALLAALEDRAAATGNTSCALVSTETAHRFYQRIGYVDVGMPEGRFGTGAGYPMFRNLTATRRAGGSGSNP